MEFYCLDNRKSKILNSGKRDEFYRMDYFFDKLFPHPKGLPPNRKRNNLNNLSKNGAIY